MIANTDISFTDTRHFIARILDASPGLIYIYDIAEGRNVYANREIVDFLGYSAQQIKAFGPSLMQTILHPDDAMAVMRHHAAFATVGDNETLEIEFRMRHADGRFRWLRSREVLFSRDENGVGTQILGIAEDITSRKLFMKALQESEEKFREYIEQAPDGVFVVDKTGRFIEANQASLDITGYEKEELLSLTFHDLLAEESREEGLAHFKELLSTGKASSDLFHRHKNGQKSCLTISAIKISDEKILGFAKDITQRILTEKKLKESEERYRTLIEQASDGIFLNDNDGKLIEANTAGCKLLGYSHEEILRLTLRDVIKVTADGPLSIKELQEGKSVLRERELICKDGTLVTVEINAKKIANGLFQGIARDITERKRMEEGLRKAQKLESLGVFAGGIAHDFNNLLGGIFGYIDMAKDSCDIAGKTRHYLDKASKTFSRAKDLTGQILTFAKGGAPLMKTGLLMPLVKDCARFALSGSNVSCAFQADKDLWPCDFDESQIRQVIDNIVINAVQAMPQGGAVKVSVENCTIKSGEKSSIMPGRYVHVSIADGGAGIPESVLPCIFDPFFTTKQKASGLGLATAYSIMKKHGGEIFAQSQSGTGAVFHLYMPVSEKSLGAEIVSKTRTHKGSGRILVMDDEEAIRETMGDMLATMGYDAEYALNGQDALTMIEKAEAAHNPYKAVFMDLTIPGGMGGKEAVGRLRKTEKDLLIFVSSGYSEDPVMSDPALYGFNDKIKKPFRRSELADLFNRHLSAVGVNKG
jgi:two-component system, cell cycle sensor histidine kinase and response regulator CckA